MVGFGALVFTLMVPRWSAAIVGTVLALWIALAPVLYQSQVMQWGSDVAAHVSERIGNSMMHRRAIWEFTAERIRERPLLGWGFGNSRIMPGSHETAKEGALASIGGLELMPLHPHNAALQLWLEAGLPGVLLGIAFVVWIARGIGRLPGAEDRALMIALVAAVTINAASGYNLWHTWWMTFMWLAAAFAIAAIPRVKTPAPPVA
jgi:O-antigen ligase